MPPKGKKRKEEDGKEEEIPPEPKRSKRICEFETEWNWWISVAPGWVLAHLDSRIPFDDFLPHPPTKKNIRERWISRKSAIKGDERLNGLFIGESKRVRLLIKDADAKAAEQEKERKRKEKDEKRQLKEEKTRLDHMIQWLTGVDQTPYSSPNDIYTKETEVSVEASRITTLNCIQPNSIPCKLVYNKEGMLPDMLDVNLRSIEVNRLVVRGCEWQTYQIRYTFYGLGDQSYLKWNLVWRNSIRRRYDGGSVSGCLEETERGRMANSLDLYYERNLLIADAYEKQWWFAVVNVLNEHIPPKFIAALLIRPCLFSADNKLVL